MAVYNVRLDSKRRPTLPAELLAEIGLDDHAGSNLVAHPMGKGRLMLETLDAARDRRRAELRNGFGPAVGGDALIDVRAWRDDDTAAFDRPTTETSDQGRALLTLLGLE